MSYTETHTLQSVELNDDQHKGTVTMLFHDPDDIPEDIVIRIVDIPELIRRLREVFLS